MKILLITDGLPPQVLGGAGQIAWASAAGLASNGHEVHLLTASNEAIKHPSATVHVIKQLPSRWAHYRSVFSSSRAAEVLEVIDSVQPDIIHAHSIAWQAGYRWIPDARARGIPVILTSHDVMYVAYGRVNGDENRFSLTLRDLKRARWIWNPFRNSIIRNILNKHCKVLCVSDALKNYLESFGFKHLTTVHNGIDLDKWDSKLNRKQAREALGLPQDKIIFFLAGRLGVDKGSQIVARTLPKDAHLLLAGDVDKESFTSVKDRTHIFGRQTSEEMRTMYTACDVTLVPSICLDCFPTTCLEAMACSRAVLATTFGGSKESVQDRKTGWILDPRDEPAFRAQMEWCVNNRDKLDAFGEEGRKRVEKHFSMHDHVKKLIELYAATAS